MAARPREGIDKRFVSMGYTFYVNGLAEPVCSRQVQDGQSVNPFFNCTHLEDRGTASFRLLWWPAGRGRPWPGSHTARQPRACAVEAFCKLRTADHNWSKPHACHYLRMFNMINLDFTVPPAVALLNNKKSCNTFSEFFPKLGFFADLLYKSFISPI